MTYLILAKYNLGGEQRGWPFNIIHDSFRLHLNLQRSRRREVTNLHHHIPTVGLQMYINILCDFFFYICVYMYNYYV